MRREYTKPNDPARLMDEILAAVPATRRVRVNARGENEALSDHLRVSGLGDRIIVEFADDIDPAQIDAVVAAHDPTKPSPPTAAELEAATARADLVSLIVNAFTRAGVVIDAPGRAAFEHSVERVVRSNK